MTAASNLSSSKGNAIASACKNVTLPAAGRERANVSCASDGSIPWVLDMRRLVGRNFARIRREKGLTQEQMEERSGFSQQYLSGLEHGRRNPTVVTLYELAQALGVTPLDLLRDHPEREPERRKSRQ